MGRDSLSRSLSRPPPPLRTQDKTSPAPASHSLTLSLHPPRVKPLSKSKTCATAERPRSEAGSHRAADALKRRLGSESTSSVVTRARTHRLSSVGAAPVVSCVRWVTARATVVPITSVRDPCTAHTLPPLPTFIHIHSHTRAQRERDARTLTHSHSSGQPAPLAVISCAGRGPDLSLSRGIESDRHNSSLARSLALWLAAPSDTGAARTQAAGPPRGRPADSAHRTPQPTRRRTPG